jgi:hypothetical protein
MKCVMCFLSSICPHRCNHQCERKSTIHATTTAFISNRCHRAASVLTCKEGRHFSRCLQARCQTTNCEALRTCCILLRCRCHRGCRLVHSLIEQAKGKVSELLRAQGDQNASVLALVLRNIARLHFFATSCMDGVRVSGALHKAANMAHL